MYGTPNTGKTGDGRNAEMAKLRFPDSYCNDRSGCALSSPLATNVSDASSPEWVGGHTKDMTTNADADN